MFQQVFSVYDKKIASYSPPFFTNHVANATRMFSDLINSNSRDNMVFQYPADFDLYHIAVFDDVTGKFECTDEDGVVYPPKFVCNGLSLSKNVVRGEVDG